MRAPTVLLMQDASVHQVLDWHKQVQHFSGPARELLTQSIALEERSVDRTTLRLLFGPTVWPQLTEELRWGIFFSVGMGIAGVRSYGRITFEKAISDPVTTPARWIRPYPRSR